MTTATASTPSADIVHDGQVRATVAPHDDNLVEECEVPYQLVARNGEVLLRVFDRAGTRAGTMPLVPATLHRLTFEGWTASIGSRGNRRTQRR